VNSTTDQEQLQDELVTATGDLLHAPETIAAQECDADPLGEPKMSEDKIVADIDPLTSTWGVGWLSEKEGFTAHWSGFDTKEEAEAEIPGFYDRLKRETKAMMAEMEAKEAEQNKTWPNIAYVRSKIKKMKNPLHGIDAGMKLDYLMELDLVQYISWPLPSWKIIKGGDSDAIVRAMSKLSSRTS
jgi:hypothetical protein